MQCLAPQVVVLCCLPTWQQWKRSSLGPVVGDLSLNRKSKANTLRLRHHSLNRSKGEGSVMTCTQIILQCKICFSISHLMPTLIQLLAHFVD